MKKILHVSNFNLLRIKGCFQNSYPFKISNGLIRNGYSVINYPDRDICRMFGFGGMNFLGRIRAQEHLIKYCKAVNPDAIFLGHTDTIETETLCKIKEMLPNVKFLQWSCDWIVPNYAERNIKALSKNKDIVDVFMVTTGDKNQLLQFKTRNNKVGYMPNFVDKSLEVGRAFLNAEPEFDMFYGAQKGIRQFCGKDTDNEVLIDAISAQIPDIKFLLAGLKGASKLAGDEYISAFSKAAMGLSLSRLNDVHWYSSDRMVHIMGNGELAFVDRRTGFDELFSDDEVAFYQTPEEFFELLKKYKKDTALRQKVAENGWKKIHAEYNERIVAKHLTDVLFDEKIGNEKWKVVL